LYQKAINKGSHWLELFEKSNGGPVVFETQCVAVDIIDKFYEPDKEQNTTDDSIHGRTL